jgi:hypothetical protein
VCVGIGYTYTYIYLLFRFSLLRLQRIYNNWNTPSIKYSFIWNKGTPICVLPTSYLPLSIACSGDWKDSTYVPFNSNLKYPGFVLAGVEGSKAHLNYKHRKSQEPWLVLGLPICSRFNIVRTADCRQ